MKSFVCIFLILLTLLTTVPLFASGTSAAGASGIKPPGGAYAADGNEWFYLVGSAVVSYGIWAAIVACGL